MGGNGVDAREVGLETGPEAEFELGDKTGTVEDKSERGWES